MARGVMWLVSLGAALTASPAAGAAVGLIKRYNISGVAAGFVRSQQNTKNDAVPLTLDPICATDGAAGFEEDTCGAKAGELSVPFNTRTYLQSRYNGGCDEVPFGNADYSCVDYGAGAVSLAGKTLSFDVDLSHSGCGCNAAVYLVSARVSAGRGDERLTPTIRSS